MALRSGLTMAELLDLLMAEAVEEPAPPPAPAPPPRPSRARRPQSRPAPDAVDLSQLAYMLAEFASRLEAVEHRPVAQRSDRSEAPRFEPIGAFDDAVGKVAIQIGKGEARAELHALQARESLRALRHRVDRLEAHSAPAPALADAQLTQLIARLDRIEAAPAPAVEASMIDAALSRLMGRVEEGQNHALGSLRALEGALAGLEQLVGQMATAPPLAPAMTSPPLAPAMTSAPLPHEETETEHRAAKAINQMGQEVIRIAQSLDGRVGEVERRSDARAAEMGGEMSRLAATVDDRLSRADDARAGALEELGGQIAGVADQLADRIAASEHRSAQIVAKGLDDVGERLQRAIDTLNAHYERAANEIASRIGESEERTGKLAAETRDHADAVTLRAAPPAPRPLRTPAVPSEPPAPRHGLEPLTGVPAPHDDGLEAALLRAPETAARPSANQALIEQVRAATRASAESQRQPARRGAAASFDEASAALLAPAVQAGEVLVLRSGLSGLLGRRRRVGG